jgi:hypothetical protein
MPREMRDSWRGSAAGPDPEGTATHDAGGLPQGSSYFAGQPWLRPRDPKDAGGAAGSAGALLHITPPPLPETHDL